MKPDIRSDTGYIRPDIRYNPINAPIAMHERMSTWMDGYRTNFLLINTEGSPTVEATAATAETTTEKYRS